MDEEGECRIHELEKQVERLTSELAACRARIKDLMQFTR
jgi:chaperonin cofactor prefoldin